MGIEGGGRFEGNYPVERPRSPEDPYGRGIEAVGAYGIEGRVEKEPSSWLMGILNPENIERIHELPAYRERSVESIILEALGAALIEKGAEWDPLRKARVRNLLGFLRLLLYPGMTPKEQESIRDLLTKATTVDFSAQTYEITPEIKEDIKWLWGAFSLQIPDRENSGNLPQEISDTFLRIAEESATTDLKNVTNDELTLTRTRFSRYKTVIDIKSSHGKISGSLLLPRDFNDDRRTRMHVDEFEVDRQMRKRGTGTRLMKALAIEAKANGATSLWGILASVGGMRTVARVFGKDNLNLSSFHFEPFDETYDELLAHFEKHPHSPPNIHFDVDLTRVNPEDLE